MENRLNGDHSSEENMKKMVIIRPSNRKMGFNEYEIAWKSLLEKISDRNDTGENLLTNLQNGFSLQIFREQVLRAQLMANNEYREHFMKYDSSDKNESGDNVLRAKILAEIPQTDKKM